MRKKLLWIVLLIIVIAGVIMFFKFAKPEENEESIETGDINFNRNSGIEDQNESGQEYKEIELDDGTFENYTNNFFYLS